MKDRFAARYICYIAAAALLLSLIPLRLAGLDHPLIQLAAVVLSSVLIWTGGYFCCTSDASDRAVMKKHLAVIFALYVILLVNFTIFDGHFGRIAEGGTSSLSFSEYFAQRVNLVPFRMIYRQTKALIAGNYLPKYFIVNVIGNLAAFAPFAFFLPLFFRKCRKFIVFFAVLSAIIIALETCQILTRVGSFDVDDYILNMLGATILFGLLATRRGRKIKERITDPRNNKTIDRSQNEKDHTL